MVTLALSETWSDLLTVGGFALTAVGFGATLLSLYYAIRQIRETKSAAEAARRAARQALEESRRSYQRYAAANAHRFINEVRIHVESREWAMAAVRLRDLADLTTHLATADPAWRELADELRVWATTLTRLSTGELVRFPVNRWGELLVRVQSKIDALHTPFPPAGEEA